MDLPAISLPKGGGAIRGIGEKFAANAVTGTGSLSVPIATSPGRSGFGPQLTLSYDSGSGNGPFGFGWSLSLPSISRKTDKGLPKYQDADESDTFALSGTEDLVPVLKQQGDDWVSEELPDRTIESDTYRIKRYLPRIEGLFSRIERWTNIRTDETHWRTLTKDNILNIYGKDGDSRIADPEDPKSVFSWLICESRDDKGNAIVYRYSRENDVKVDRTQTNERNRVRTANRYPKRIMYGNRIPLLDDAGRRPPFFSRTELDNAGWMFEVVFDYGEHDRTVPKPDDAREWDCRNDPFSTYRAGFEVRTYRLCQRVLMFHHFPSEESVGDNCLVRSTDFTYSYEQDPNNARNPVYSFLCQVTQTGYKRDGAGFIHSSLPPLEFKYSQPNVQDTVEEVDPASLENLPVGVDGTVYRWTDLHGEGIPGVLTEQAHAWFYNRNFSTISKRPVEFGPMERVASKPNLSLTGSRAQFIDLAGDGQPDLVILDGPVPGFYEHDGDRGWQSFQPFTSRLNRDMRDPNLKFLDLDGNGHTDVLISEDDAFVWHASLAEEGFGPAQRVHQVLDEQKGPRLVFSDGTESIYLADLSGDGLTDLARVRNGEVCYWPNLGYGRFGAKVTMDNAPFFDNPDQFDHERLRMADIDGSGTTDIIYLHGSGVRLYFNQSGNSWSLPRQLRSFPHKDDLVSIMAADLLGNGTACLVWSSKHSGDARRPMRYINLMGKQKPHLLTKIVNNLGAETQIDYAPSTKFYLQDQRDGKPWITRLPFPVHVVERVETYDHISRNRFVTRYAYHHGFFDGAEREFRGFGMVEQWDTDTYATMETNGSLADTGNWAEAFHVPPVLTKTWFHTGLFLGHERVSNFFAGLLDAEDRGEYYREPAWRDDDDEAKKRLLEDTVLPSGLTLEEKREACRALKGSLLRQEVYALDGTEKESHPYTVTEQNFTIKCLQPRGENRHGVFLTHARQTINYHYERNPADPRIRHDLTLDVDRYANVLKSASIVYGRFKDSPEIDLSSEDLIKQRLIHITYTENTFTKPFVPNDSSGDVGPLALDEPDAYRTPLPAESRTYELRKEEQEQSIPGQVRRFQFNEVLDWITQARDGDHDVSYEDLEFSKASEIVANEPQKRANYFRRLIENVRTFYRPDDLGLSAHNPLTLLPFGTVQALALPGESYKLAFTPGMLEQVFVRDGQSLLPSDPSDLLSGGEGNGGGYVDIDNDGHWWIPTGRIFYSSGTNDDAAAELADARSHFYLPRRYRDPFHSEQFNTESFVDYDTYDLLILESRDALGNRVTAGERDPDPSRPPLKKWLDYRILQPELIMDPNRNRTQVVFDALGLVVGTAVMGKPEDDPQQGDFLDSSFVEDLLDTDIDAFYDAIEPHVLADNHLKTATTRIIYDINRFFQTQQANPQDPEKWEPVFAATLARETHVSDLENGEQARLQISFSYSDGFGRVIQKKIQAEPGPLVEDGPSVSPRWVGNGWTIFNNKGNPVRQYEPFFSQLPEKRHRFEFGMEAGVSSVLFYDPVERVVATLRPNHTYEKVVYDPWKQATYDVNDTVTAHDTQTGDPRTDPDIGGYVGAYFTTQPADWQTWYTLRSGGQMGDSERDAAEKAAAHVDTPTVAYFDSLGRPFNIVTHQKIVCPNHAQDGEEDTFHTRIELDIDGNQLEVRDAVTDFYDDLGNVHSDPQGRSVMCYDYDMLGNRIHQASMEAGQRWKLSDVAGNPLWSWNNRGHNFYIVYDQLRRPIRSYMSDGSADPTLIGKTVYGETRSNPENSNLREQTFQRFDQGGVVTNADFDFKGNLLNGRRQLAQEFRTKLDWSAPVIMEAPIYTSRTRYDALNRPTQLIAPHSDQAGKKINIIQPVYNEAGLLQKMNAWLNQNTEPAKLLDPMTADLNAVSEIEYDARGQRIQINYGNGVKTTYQYDPLTYRLVHLRTTRGNQDALECAPALDPRTCEDPPPICHLLASNKCVLQDLHYCYDPVGNITYIQDDAQQIIYFKNKRVEPSNAYTYDALYRLIEAKGREHLGQIGGSPIPHSQNDGTRTGLQHPGNGNAMGIYVEHYVYDAVGNFVEMRHRGSDPAHPGWTRTYAYEEASQIEGAKQSNRLSSTTVGSNNILPDRYVYDTHGNIIHMPHLAQHPDPDTPNMHLDYRDKLCRADLNGGRTAYYVYDANGRRLRKVIERQNGTMQEERIYFGGFEIYREYNGASGDQKLVRETMHILDDQQRIAQIETRTDTSSAEPLIRYQIGNHLASVSLEVDDLGRIITYEEYTPYGSTSYQAVRSKTETPKRYRHIGMERDEESGLYYQGARYYAAWLGRWTSCDPIGISSGLNLFLSSEANPIRYTDRTGLANEDVITDGIEKLEIVDLVMSDYDYGWAPAGEKGTFCTLDGRYCSGYFRGAPDTSAGRTTEGATNERQPSTEESAQPSGNDLKEPVNQVPASPVDAIPAKPDGQVTAELDPPTEPTAPIQQETTSDAVRTPTDFSKDRNKPEKTRASTRPAPKRRPKGETGEEVTKTTDGGDKSPPDADVNPPSNQSKGNIKTEGRVIKKPDTLRIIIGKIWLRIIDPPQEDYTDVHDAIEIFKKWDKDRMSKDPGGPEDQKRRSRRCSRFDDDTNGFFEKTGIKIRASDKRYFMSLVRDYNCRITGPGNRQRA